MKTLILFVFSLTVFTSCIIEDVEPRYDHRDNAVGNYDVEEYSETYNDMTFYSMQIKKSGYSNEIRFVNFYGVDIDVYATLRPDNSITIPFQVVDGYEVDGVGSLHGNELNLTYRVKDRYSNDRTDFCETVAWFDY
jgi:hypothetical protein